MAKAEALIGQQLPALEMLEGLYDALVRAVMQEMPSRTGRQIDERYQELRAKIIELLSTPYGAEHTLVIGPSLIAARRHYEASEER